MTRREDSGECAVFPRFGQDLMLALGGGGTDNWNAVLVDWHEVFVAVSRFAFPDTIQGDRTKVPPGPWEFLACSGPVDDKKEPARVEEKETGPVVICLRNLRRGAQWDR